MAKIDLLKLYPKFRSGMHEKETCVIEIPDEITEEYIKSLTPEIALVHIEFERQEKAHNRKLFRYKAFYSLDTEAEREYRGEQLECELVDCVPSAEDVFISNQDKSDLYNALKQLPEKQLARIYKHYFMNNSKADIAKSENVTEFVVRSGIDRGLKCLKLRMKN